MVYVARQAFGPAHDAATRGAEGQHQQSNAADARFPAAGLDWMRGLVAIGHGDENQALAHFAAEGEAAGRGHVYGREFRVQALVAQGFILLARVDDTAADRFRAALAIVGGHARATLGLMLASGPANHETVLSQLAPIHAELTAAGRATDAALLSIAGLAWTGRTSEAVAQLSQLLEAAPAGSTGWSLPVDPMFAPLRHASGMDRILARLASRAA
jgi:hypothetical protein